MMKFLKQHKCSECSGYDAEFNEDFKCGFCGTYDKKQKQQILDLIKPETNIEKYYINIYIKLLDGTITESEEKIFLKFFELNMIEEKNFNDVHIILDRMLDQKINISFELFKEIFKFSIIKGLREINNGTIEIFNPRCEITKLDENTRGCCECNNINNIVVAIDEEVIKIFYETGKVDTLITMYHEMQHVIQHINIKIGVFTENLLIQIKENLINEYEQKKYNTETYYNNNYENISYEADARYRAVTYIINLLSKFNLKLSESKLNDLDKNYIGTPDLKNRKIIVNGEEKLSAVDEIFETIVRDNPEWLELYPQLKIEYINDNGVVRRKNAQELSMDIDDILNNHDEYADEKIEYISKLYRNSKIM